MRRRDANARRQLLKNHTLCKTSTGATKFKVRAFARSSRAMQKKQKNRCEGLCKRRFFTRTFKMAKTLPKPLPKTHPKSRRNDVFFVFLPKSAPRASQERPGAPQECPKSRKTSKNTQKHAKTHQNTKKRTKTRKNSPKQ